MTNPHPNRNIPVSKYRETLICLLLVTITFALYQQVYTFDFIDLDDNLYVYENSYVKGGLSAGNVKWAFSNLTSGMWIPITWLSLMTDSTLFGTSPSGYHFTNLIIHLINITLLFILLRNLTGDFWPSAFVAALFAFHPLHVESVAWVTERKDVLSAFFFFLTLMSYSCYSQKQNPLWYLIACLFYALGLMSKPMLVTVPFILILIDFWPLNRVERNKIFNGRLVHLILEKTPFLVLAISVSAVTYYTLQKDGGIFSLESSPISMRATNALVSYVKYIAKLFYPDGLTVLYPHGHTTSWLKMSGAFGLLSAISWIIVRNIRRAPFLIVGWLWYLGMLIPVIGIVHAGPQAMADRFVYLPIIGLYIIIAWGAAEFSKRRAYRKITFTVLSNCFLLIAVTISWNQLQHWKNSITLFNHTLNHTSSNYIIHNNLGRTLHRKGLPEKAIPHFQEALRIMPFYEDARNNLGLALAKMNQVDEAIEQYQIVIKRNHQNHKAHNNLGLALKQKGLILESIEHYNEALRITPDFLAAHINLGNLYTEQQNITGAIHHYLSALKIDPENASLHNHLGIAFFLNGEMNRARSHFEQAIGIRPAFVNARINLGNILVNMGNLSQAIGHYTEALRANPNAPEVHYHLGIALLLSGQKDLAKNHIRTAFRIQPDFDRESHTWKTTIAIPDEIVNEIDAFRPRLNMQGATGTNQQPRFSSLVFAR